MKPYLFKFSLFSLMSVCLAVGHAGAQTTVEQVLQSVIKIESEIPQGARTAGALGTERLGNGVVIDEDLEVDFQRREVIVRGERVKLRPTEYRLLYHLVNNAGWVMTHEMLLAKVWGHEYREESHLLRLYITYLRKKIEPDPSHPKYILTERGMGYRFVDFRKKPD